MSTYTPIATQTLGSAAASVTFSSIPQGYTDLVLVCSPVSTTGSNTYMWVRYNDDSGSNYSSTIMRGNGSAAGSVRLTNQTYQYICYSAEVPTVAGRTTVITQLQNYSNSTTYKTALTRNNDVVQITEAIASLWRNTAPITSITIDMDASGSVIAAGSTFSIYGIQVGDKAQKAQGGNIVTTDGTYMYHAFTSSGSFIPSEALTADVLVVAGGGGAGKVAAGGGGAGGYRLLTSQSLIKTTYPVTVGAGGAGATMGSGFSGGNSIFSTITSAGGGGGGGIDTEPYAGGSGGGGSAKSVGGPGYGAAGNTPSTSPSQGNSGGGSAANRDYGSGGGGGGASSAGTQGGIGNNDNAGNGGAGTAPGSTWASTTNTGVSGYYAGGGAGGAYFANGTGGAGGGGSNGQAGTTNTGGGGGATGQQGDGKSGGSGIVIIRYAL
jgi:hypothetical protein